MLTPSLGLAPLRKIRISLSPLPFHSFLMDFKSGIKVAYLNCRAQTGFSLAKQLQIENFLQTHEIDILHLQESHIDSLIVLWLIAN